MTRLRGDADFPRSVGLASLLLAVEGRGGADDEPDRTRSDFEYADSSRSLAVGLGGTSLAVLTFFLFFGFDRAASGQIDPAIFRVPLGTIVLTMFLFVYSAAGYYLYMEASLRRLPNADVHLRRANFFLTLAIVGITLEPALILYAARLTEVAMLAFVLWLVSLVLLLLGLRGFRRSLASAVPTISQGIQQ